MPVPFRDLSDDFDLGLAGFLRFEDEPGGRGIRAALFYMTSRGEPIEFGFTRIDVAGPSLWRAGDARRHAVTALSKALFEASRSRPTLLLALAEEVPARVFGEDLEVHVPTCRVASPDTVADASDDDSTELLTDDINLFWTGELPGADSQARLLLAVLQSRRLLTEPFERASVGLEEAFNHR